MTIDLRWINDTKGSEMIDPARGISPGQSIALADGREAAIIELAVGPGTQIDNPYQLGTRARQTFAHARMVERRDLADILAGGRR